MTDPIKITSLEAENVKRLRAVQLHPSATGLTIIGGNNNQGKTSLLDTIAWALGGDRFRPSMATREGSTIPPHIKVTLSNGLIVERRGKNSDLKVIDPSGSKAGQQLLNAFIEQLALDLPRFMQASDREKADISATHGMALSILHGLLCTVAGIAIMPGFLRRFTSEESLVSMGVLYATIVFLFSIVNMADLAFEKMFQAVGRMNTTMIALIAGCVCNIALDPVLIFGLGPVPALGIAGAALATNLGQLITLCIYLYCYATSDLPVRLRRRHLHFEPALDGKLYAIGIPAILNLALPSLLVTFLNGLLAAFSQSYVTVLGIYYKLQTFLYLPANGIVQGMRPLVGYNYGAREHGRVARLYNLTLGLSAAIMAVGTVLCLTISGSLIGLFSSNPETIAIGTTALRIICLGFVVSAVSTTSSGALEGLGKGVPSLVISLCRYVFFIMPLAWVLCRTLGPTGVWHAFWITEACSAAIAFVVYRRAVSKR